MPMPPVSAKLPVGVGIILVRSSELVARRITIYIVIIITVLRLRATSLYD